MRTILVGLVVAGVLAVPVWASRLGLGLGFCELGFGGGELWAEFRPEAPLAGRLSLVYLAPLLPGEGAAVGFLGGLRLALGEGLRPFLSGAGGLMLERVEVGGPGLGWAAAACGGLEWLGSGWGLYLSATAYLVLRATPAGTVFYPYFLYSLGLSWGR